MFQDAEPLHEMSTDSAVNSAPVNRKYSDGTVLFFRIVVTVLAVVLTVALIASPLEYLLSSIGIGLSLGEVMAIASVGAVIWPAARWFSGSYDFD